LETNPGNARALVQKHGNIDVWLNPPPIPLTTPEMDFVFGLPYARLPHPSYNGVKIPAYDMIRFSVNIMRGCFGGCTFLFDYRTRRAHYPKPFQRIHHP